LMRLLTAGSPKNVVVSSEVSGELTLVKKGRSRRDIMRACAARSGGVLERVGNTHVVLPAASAAQTLKLYRRHLRKRRRWPGRGRRVDLDFQRADLRNLVRLISDVSGLKIQGTAAVKGKLSVRARNVPWNRLLDLMLLVQGLGVQSGSKPGKAAVATLAELTAGKPLALAPIKPAEVRPRPKLDGPPPQRRVRGHWYPVGSLKLVAIVTGPGRPRALLQPPGWPALIIKQGDRVGKEALKVTSIAKDGVTLVQDAPGKSAAQVRVKLGGQIKP
jgi:hypothetical protein